MLAGVLEVGVSLDVWDQLDSKGFVTRGEVPPESPSLSSLPLGGGALEEGLRESRVSGCLRRLSRPYLNKPCLKCRRQTKEWIILVFRTTSGRFSEWVGHFSCQTVTRVSYSSNFVHTRALSAEWHLVPHPKNK